MLKHAAKVYTRNVFNKFKDEISEVFRYKVEDVGVTNRVQSFVVKSKVYEIEKFIVKLDSQTYAGVGVNARNLSLLEYCAHIS